MRQLQNASGSRISPRHRPLRGRRLCSPITSPSSAKANLTNSDSWRRILKGKTVKMVNSTAVGGGVAEMLNRLVPLLSELEVPTRWEVITGGNDFFEITKAFHNALHGGEYQLTPQVKEVFLRYSEQNRQRMHFDEDMVVIHDPQPAALIRARESGRSKWIWRCHIDLSNPNRDVWGFLRPMIDQFDAAIFSSSVVCAAARHPAVPVLSVHRSAL